MILLCIIQTIAIAIISCYSIKTLSILLKKQFNIDEKPNKTDYTKETLSKLRAIKYGIKDEEAIAPDYE